jgi:hypothetical protein
VVSGEAKIWGELLRPHVARCPLIR